MNKYANWIQKKLESNDPCGKCEKWCHEMIKVFPELKLQRGFYHCLIWGKREHWWLKDKNDEIIDPTIKQFPNTFGTYEKWIEGTPEPTGKCSNCGQYCYNDNYVCSEACKTELKKDFPTMI